MVQSTRVGFTSPIEVAEHAQDDVERQTSGQPQGHDMDGLVDTVGPDADFDDLLPRRGSGTRHKKVSMHSRQEWQG